MAGRLPRHCGRPHLRAWRPCREGGWAAAPCSSRATLCPPHLLPVSWHREEETWLVHLGLVSPSSLLPLSASSSSLLPFSVPPLSLQCPSLLLDSLSPSSPAGSGVNSQLHPNSGRTTATSHNCQVDTVQMVPKAGVQYVMLGPTTKDRGPQRGKMTG